MPLVEPPKTLTPRGLKFHHFVTTELKPRLSGIGVRQGERYYNICFSFAPGEMAIHHVIDPNLPQHILDFNENYFLREVWFDHIEPGEEEMRWAYHMFFYLVAIINLHWGRWFNSPIPPRRLAVYFESMNPNERMTSYSKALLCKASTLYYCAVKHSSESDLGWNPKRLAKLCDDIDKFILDISSF